MALPNTIPFNGDWPSYVEEIYQVYVTEIAEAGLTFKKLRVSCKRRPSYDNKHYAFWHTISEGEVEDDRLPDLDRCARITWIPYLINNIESDTDICWWENTRGRNTNIVILHENANFVVILSKRSGYYLLITAYTPRPSRMKTLIKERDAFWAQKG